MQILIFINFAAALQGIFLTYLIGHNKPKESKSLVLGALTFVLSISLLGGVYGLSGYYKTFPHFTNVADPFFLLYGPLLYIYIYLLTQNRLPEKYYLHALPYVVYVISFIPLYLKTGEEKIEFVEYIFLNDEVPLKGLLMQFVKVLHIAIYVILSLVLVRKHQRKIKENFSDIERISLSKAKRILYFFLFALLVAVLSFLLGYLIPYSYNLSNNIIGLIIGIIIYALAYSTWNTGNIKDVNTDFKEKAEADNIISGFNKSKGRSVFVLSDEQFRDFGSRLEKAIAEEKAFIENELSLTELSKKINIQPYQLSELISRIYGESFFDFINRYRIEEIKERLENPSSNSYSLLGIAIDCGFNSKSSFNTAFKKFTGLTPSEYRKQMLTVTTE